MPLLDPNHLSPTGQRIMPLEAAPIVAPVTDSPAPSTAELYADLKMRAERSIASRRAWLATPFSGKVD